MDNFYVTLPSDASANLYPDNKRGHYVTKLKQDISLVGHYEVAIVELQFKHDFYNFTVDENHPVFYLHVPKTTLLEKVQFNSSFYQPSLYELRTSRVFELIHTFTKTVDEVWKLVDRHIPVNDLPKNALNYEMVSAISEFNNSEAEDTNQASLHRLFKVAETYQPLCDKISVTLQSKHAEDGLRNLLSLSNNLTTIIKDFETILQMHGLPAEPSKRHERSLADIILQPFLPTNDSTKFVTVEAPPSSELMRIYLQLKDMQSTAEQQRFELSRIVQTLQQQPVQDGRLHSTVVYSAVPILYIPNFQENGTTVYRIPVHARSGFYESPQKLVDALNGSLRYNKFMKNADKLALFTYDWSLGKIKLHLSPNIAVKDVVPSFADLIGFSGTENSKGTILATKPATFHEKWQLMYIYSDVADYNFVGDSMSQLLRCMPVQGERGVYTVVRFDSPHFVPVLKGGISTLEIILANEYAERFPIRSGKTIAKLMFRPRVRHIF